MINKPTQEENNIREDNIENKGKTEVEEEGGEEEGVRPWGAQPFPVEARTDSGKG